jgi:hypothetical protein
MRLTLALLLLLPIAVFAQQAKMYMHSGIAMNSYKGDLGTYDKYTGGFQLGIQLNKKKRLNGAFNLGFGRITDDDPSIQPSGLSGVAEPNNFFKTNFIYLNYDLHINIIKKQNLIVYISQGIGFMRFTPKNNEGESLQDQQDTRELGESYRNSALMLPTSMGVIYFLPNNFGLSLQSGIYNTSTDYLDNISAFGDAGNDNILAFRLAFYVPLGL